MSRKCHIRFHIVRAWHRVAYRHALAKTRAAITIVSNIIHIEQLVIRVVSLVCTLYSERERKIENFIRHNMNSNIMQ